MDNTITQHPKQQLTPLGKLPHTLYSGNGVVWCGTSLWPAQFSCPGPSPSQLLVHLLPGRTRETEKSLIESKHNLTTIKLSVCYEHYSHPTQMMGLWASVKHRDCRETSPQLTGVDSLEDFDAQDQSHKWGWNFTGPETHLSSAFTVQMKG